MGNLAEAHESHRRAFEIAREAPQVARGTRDHALAAYALSCQKVCDWGAFEALLPRLETVARAEVASAAPRPSVSPFSALALPWPADLQAALSCLASARIPRSTKATAEELAFRFDRRKRTADPDRPLRVGYLSGNFRNHALSHLMTPVFGQHDRDQVRVFTY
jgi:predicted O-linked N-acetylglucosamine transferase (SPINDLY family)